MNTSDTLQLIAIGGILGAMGQLLRIVIGKRKMNDTAKQTETENKDIQQRNAAIAQVNAVLPQVNVAFAQQNATPSTILPEQPLKEMPQFSNQYLVISLLIGAAAGILSALFVQELKDKDLQKEFYTAVIAAGYAGADFIDGFMGKFIK
jgi:fluoride ion exporter CrcB/FEX